MYVEIQDLNTDRSAQGEELYAEKNSSERCVLDIYTYKDCVCVYRLLDCTEILFLYPMLTLYT